MATSRSRGCSRVTSRSPISTRPEVGISRPARMRSAVVLPQPDGPSSARNGAVGHVEVEGLAAPRPHRSASRRPRSGRRSRRRAAASVRRMTSGCSWISRWATWRPSQRGTDDQLDGAAAQLTASERTVVSRCGMRGERDVVVADDRDVVRHATAAALQPIDGGDRLHVVVGHDRRGAAARRPAPGRGAPAPPRSRGGGARPHARHGAARRRRCGDGRGRGVLDDRLHRGHVVMVDDAEPGVVELAAATPARPACRGRAAASAASSRATCRR